MRIAILEDDTVQAGQLTEVLSVAGHICHIFAAGDQLVRRLRRETFDLLILEWVVPGMSGEDVLRWTRQNLSNCLPVLFLTKRSRESDIVSILNMGADDYLVKPVAMAILSVHVETLLRRAYAFDPAATRAMFGQIEFNLTSQQVHMSGKIRAVTQKEFALALLLFRYIGQPVSRAHIIETVWGQANDVLSRTIDTHVTRVRAKLGLRPENGFRLSCVYGYGYRLDSVEKEEGRESA
ncbi:MAG: response regulator transcription factor [Paraburkholderia sp.]|uniref:response regulator transcription factor n=1 Tax=Burkholderiaceae TaxID=119060 RepID=UPI0010F478B7|nr:response regulator transcription factor [Burkholderia sp. 4M9327F10]